MSLFFRVATPQFRNGPSNRPTGKMITTQGYPIVGTKKQAVLQDRIIGSLRGVYVCSSIYVFNWKQGWTICKALNTRNPTLSKRIPERGLKGDWNHQSITLAMPHGPTKLESIFLHSTFAHRSNMQRVNVLEGDTVSERGLRLIHDRMVLHGASRRKRFYFSWGGRRGGPMLTHTV